MNGTKPDMIIIDEPMEGIDYGVMEQMISSKLIPKTVDEYQEYADKHGITREEAKSKLFAKHYGAGGTGIKDWKKDLRQLFQPKDG